MITIQEGKVSKISKIFKTDLCEFGDATRVEYYSAIYLFIHLKKGKATQLSTAKSKTSKHNTSTFCLELIIAYIIAISFDNIRKV